MVGRRAVNRVTGYKTLRGLSTHIIRSEQIGFIGETKVSPQAF